jgi:hypothetical protein
MARLLWPVCFIIVRSEALRQRLGDDGTIAWDELAKKAGIVWQPQEYRPEGPTAV